MPYRNWLTSEDRSFMRSNLNAVSLQWSMQQCPSEVVPDSPPARLSPYVTSWRKRTLDLVLGIPLLLLAVPAIAVLALMVALSLRTWPFFVQQRLGRDGRPFTILKLRTLPPCAPRYVDRREVDEVPTTRVGRYLRRSHLDELPQLFLVVSGAMSLVGPRPAIAVSHERFGVDDARFRLRSRPGCTGLWQISREADRPLYEAPHHDRRYLEQARLTLDLYLLWATLGCLLNLGLVLPVRRRLARRSSVTAAP
jgi:lipopolysaccharide/colanic/teichoic acid biosynthesis glycosyltransferase